jgi:hypothetical protein
MASIQGKAAPDGAIIRNTPYAENSVGARVGLGCLTQPREGKAPGIPPHHYIGGLPRMARATIAITKSTMKMKNKI